MNAVHPNGRHLHVVGSRSGADVRLRAQEAAPATTSAPPQQDEERTCATPFVGVERLSADSFDTEACTLRAVLSRSQETRTGRTILLTGPAGGIRTRLLQDMAAHAAAAGFAVAAVQGNSDHRRPLRALLAGLSRGRTPVLSHQATRAIAAVRDNPLLQMRMLQRLLRCHALTRGVLVTIDDAHELDPESRWVISQLPVLLADCAVVWVHSAPDWYLVDLAVDAPGIQLLARGEIILAPAKSIRRPRPRHGPASMTRPRLGWASLTPRELRIARLVAQGKSNRAVAEALFVSPETVGTHLRAVFGKLDVDSRVQLARYVLENDDPAGSAHRLET